MKKYLIVTVMISACLFACRTKNVYNTTYTAPQSSSPSGDNQPYQQPPSSYSTPPANNQSQQQYSDPNYNSQQQYNNNTQVYNNQQYADPAADQYYASHQQNVDYSSSSYQTFYDELSPYGSWVNYGGYGYVWVPAQGPDFRPYATNGHWVYTQYGWTWVSGYNWGWAPFHYGRWMDEPGYGWMWVPGNTWAPAQVTWGSCNGYYGWAPMGPNMNYYEGYRPPVQNWNFCPENHIAESNVNNYVVNHNNNTTIINNNTTNIVVINNQNTYNNNYYNAGPSAANVERATGHKIEVVNITESNKPLPAGSRLSGNTLNLYRPAISQTTAVKAAPQKVIPVTDVKSVNATAVHGVIKQNTLPANPNAGHNNPNNPSNPYQSIPRGKNPTENEQTPVKQPQQPTQQEPHIIGQHPVENKPIQPKSIEEKPVQARPVEEKPVQSRPIEEKPIQSRPIQEKPIQKQESQTSQPTRQSPPQQRNLQRPANKPAPRPVQQHPQPAKVEKEKH